MSRQDHLLFRSLDLDADGACSREDLHRAAAEQGWGWHQAPLLAVLDLLATAGPISRERFISIMGIIRGDPRGPYGEVLRRSPRPPLPPGGGAPPTSALLIIDPQRSFTEGAWARSVGPGSSAEVAPIARAFARCGARLRRSPPGTPLLLTRCPFPPGSYAWDEGLTALLPPDAPYFVKPGNSALRPETNGLAEHLAALLERGLRRLIIGGCTLNSCVRVTGLELAARFGPRGLRLTVDLDLCGARAANYRPSAEYGGRSSVDSAIQQLEQAGVEIEGALPGEHGAPAPGASDRPGAGGEAR